MSQGSETVIEFGPFRLDLQRRELTKAGIPVPLGDRAFEILRVLVAHAPQVVSKATLLEQAWHGVLIEESTLRFHMSSLRKALGDGEDGNRYISTASGRGYCFVAKLSYATDQRRERAEADNDATNLPTLLTPIIGRERELAELAQLLGLGRLVTLAGPGGVGKTRLAVELGWHVLGEFMHGVWLVDLAPLHNQNAVASALAATLRISVTQAETALATIVATISKTKMLLIFDNCEHLADKVAGQIKTLLEGAPGVRVLATSQKHFHLEGEQVCVLDPLPVPPGAELGRFAAAELFVTRARALDRQFRPDSGNEAGIAQICRQLDGLPLALEMAAGRVRLLGVEGLRQGLNDRLRLFKAGPPVDARHSSLHSMLEWSYMLLEPLDQKIFRRLGIFPASFSLEAAIAVAGGNEAERWDSADALGRLLDRSLLALERREPPRYRLLETLRLYAAEKLREAGEQDEAAELYACHFIKIFEEAEACWDETPDPDWTARYHLEFENLPPAFDWALARPERSRIAIDLAACGFFSGSYWVQRLPTALRYLDRIIPLLDANTPAATACRLLSYSSGLYGIVRDPREALLAERAIALCRESGELQCLPTALLALNQCLLHQNRVEEADALLVEAKQLLAGSKHKKQQLRLLTITAINLHHAGALAEAVDLQREALALAQTFKSRFQATIIINLGLFEFAAGEVDDAVEHARAAIALADTRFGHGNGLLSACLANYLIAKGELAEARHLLRQALSIFIESRNYPLRLCLDPCAWLAGLEGMLPEAAQLVGFTDADRERHGEPLDPAEIVGHNRLTAILQAGLPQAELTSLMAKGAQWGEDEAIAFAANQIIAPEGLITDRALAE